MRPIHEILAQIERSPIDPGCEPSVEVYAGDTVIGEMPEYFRRMWCYMIRLGEELYTLADKVSRSGDPDLISLHGKLNMTYQFVERVFWLEMLTSFETKCPDIWMLAMIERVDVRRGWQLVWRHDEEFDDEQEVEYTPENDNERYDDEEDDDDLPPPPSNTRH